MTSRLSREGFARARAFVEATGRPLDRALLAFGLGEAGSAPVLNALVGYQNSDGGFGHGLEPDLATPASSAIATSVGLRVLSEVDADSSHPMVRAALDWLEQAVDGGVW